MAFILDHFGPGLHGTDLKNRGFFDGIEVRTLDVGQDFPSSAPNASLITVPISAANELVQSIIARRGKQHLIIDASGIMRSANVDIPFPYDTVSHFHLLAGPASPGAVNMAIVRGKIRNTVYEKMLVNAEQKGVQIIETTTEEHDTVMAVIQGLTYAVSLVLAEKDILPPDMIERRNKTPARTGAEMITLNMRVQPVIRNFIRMEGDFGSALENYIQRLQSYLVLHGHSLDQFVTPYFRLLRQHAQEGIFNGIDREIINKALSAIFSFTPDELTIRIDVSKNR